MARERIHSLTRRELLVHGVTEEIAKAWRDFYRNEAARNPNNRTAVARAQLMERAMDLLRGDDFP